MGMTVGVPKETFPGERRVALTPGVVQRLAGYGLDVLVESGAGADAGYPDAEFVERGAKIAGGRGEVFEKSDIVTQVLCYGSNDKTGKADVALMRRDQVLI